VSGQPLDQRQLALQKMAALVREFEAMEVEPPYTMEAAEALSTKALRHAVKATGWQLVHTKEVLERNR
jgi:hypothetical protein